MKIIRRVATSWIICTTLLACGNPSDEVADKKTSTADVNAVASAQARVDTARRADTTDDGDNGPVIFRREWDPGRADEAQVQSRFLARAYPAGPADLVLTLDTTTARVTQRPSNGYGNADFIRISHLRSGETFTYHCYVTGSTAIGQIGGVSNRGTPERFEHPRLAWRFDTTTLRIRQIAADSVYCTIVEPD